MKIVNTAINLTSLSMSVSTHTRGLGYVNSLGQATRSTVQGDSVSSENPNSSSVSVSNRNSLSKGMLIERERYEETEIGYFSVQGNVQTQNNAIVSINNEMLLQRHFSLETRHRVESPMSLYDPLVINTAHGNIGVDNEKFSFDLNSDGKEEKISTLSKGNAFLVYDKNNNRRADDGSELFGVSSGDGFKDLALYDKDQNGWIDEGDAVFKDLHIWYNNLGNASFRSLQEAGIGALFLDKTSLEFTYKDNMNTTHAQLKSASVYLYESGDSGTIGQVDLAVSEENTNTAIIDSSTSKAVNSLQDTSPPSLTEQTIAESLEKQIKELEGKVRRLEQQKTPQNEEMTIKQMQMLKVQIYGLEQRLFRVKNPQGFSTQG